MKPENKELFYSIIRELKKAPVSEREQIILTPQSRDTLIESLETIFNGIAHDSCGEGLRNELKDIIYDNLDMGMQTEFVNDAIGKAIDSIVARLKGEMEIGHTWEQICEQMQKKGIEGDFDLKPGTLKDQNSDSHVFVTPGDKHLVEAEKVDPDEQNMDHVET